MSANKVLYEGREYTVLGERNGELHLIRAPDDGVPFWVPVEACSPAVAAVASEAPLFLLEALIDALIDARQNGGDSAAWYQFAVEALKAAGYDEYGNPL